MLRGMDCQQGSRYGLVRCYYASLHKATIKYDLKKDISIATYEIVNIK